MKVTRVNGQQVVNQIQIKLRKRDILKLVSAMAFVEVVLHAPLTRLRKNALERVSETLASNIDDMVDQKVGEKLNKNRNN